MIAHEKAPGAGDAGGSRDQVGTGSLRSLSAGSDIGGCSRGFVCLTWPLAKLEAAHHCPCPEAAAALAGVVA